MREIKFRAWDETANTMIYADTDIVKTYHKGMFLPNGMEVEITLEGHAFINKQYDYESPSFLDNKLTLLQYTGLKDKNGKEIYEGDILDTHAQYDDIYIRKVIYKDCGLYLEPGTGYTLTKGNEKHFEVIGNIYENPALLSE